MKLYLAIFTLITAYACNQNEKFQSSITYPDGGYSYPKEFQQQDSDFYFYPVRDTFSSKDSIKFVQQGSCFFKAYDEPNLSIKPQPKNVFRLVYFDGALSSMKPVFISLKQNEIVVKRGVKGYYEPIPDTNNLDFLEREHFRILEDYFPIKPTSYYPPTEKYFNSLIKLHPEVLDPNYYRYLMDKAADYGEKFIYKTTKVSISNKTYHHLVNLINASGYWKLPYKNYCHDMPSDAASFFLEANTSRKYNIVQSVICPNDTTSYKKACQELINYAGLSKKIDLLWVSNDTASVELDIKEVQIENIK